MADSALKIIYLGGDAGAHAIDMRQLGNSLIGVDRLISDLIVTLSAQRLPRRKERAPFVVKAREPQAGSVEIPANIQEAAGLLPLGWQVLQTAGPEIIWNWLKAVFTFNAGDAEGAEVFLEKIIELQKLAHEAQDRAGERHMQENREWREMLLQLVARTQPAAA